MSPFLSLPTAVPLPYSYKPLPSTLPPSILTPPVTGVSSNDTSTPPVQQQQQQDQQQQQQQQQVPYVVSGSGTRAHPDQILSSCTALQEHLRRLEEDARRTLSEWEERRRQEDLAEKRRVAPGWLDSGVHILRPEGVDEQGKEGGKGKQQQENLMDLDPQAERKAKEGEELDRVFGGLKV